jgi:hypothetical protein
MHTQLFCTKGRLALVSVRDIVRVLVGEEDLQKEYGVEQEEE